MKGYLEVPDERTLAALDAINFSSFRKDFFGAMIDDGYLGPNVEDMALVPRVLGGSYVKVIEDAAEQLTRAILTFANRDRDFILKYLRPDDRWKTLIEEYGILDKVPQRMVGEIRYDFALAGPLTEENPPQLLEINGAALGLYAFGSFLPRTVKNLVPGLHHLTYTDVVGSFVKLGQRVGPEIATFSPGGLFWGDHLLAEATDSFHFVTPTEVPNQHLWPRLKRAVWRIDSDGGLSLSIDGVWRRMNGFRWARVITGRDIDRFGELFRSVLHGPTVYMSHPRVEFATNKGVLPLLCDEHFLRSELQIANPYKVMQYVTPTRKLADVGFPKRADWEELVLKQNFGSGGENVFVGDAIEKAVGKVQNPESWIVQDRHYLNQMYARLLYSSDRALGMDLGVFVNYDFKDGKLEYLNVAGIVARGSHQSLVNVTRGGAAIPVFWTT